MGYDLLVKKQVDSAFRLVGDLASNVVLQQSKTTGYDFNSGTVQKAVSQPKIIKGIIQNKRRNDSSNTRMTALLIKSVDIDDPTLYDTVLVDNVLWNIVPPYNDNGYTITFEIRRE
jgi:hypothetical protein